jgi:polyadenylation factor subunit 2
MIKYFTPHLTNIHGFQGHREACHGAAWSPNDERFVTGGDDGLVKIWNYREAKEEKVLSGELAGAWTRDSAKLISLRSRLGRSMCGLASYERSRSQRVERHAGQVLGS